MQNQHKRQSRRLFMER